MILQAATASTKRPDMTDYMSTAPRAFISYAWSSPTHQSWVIALATRLREEGVDVTLDVWDLKPGHDSYQFMEKMVTDKSVTKVLMICDKNYADKANSRAGGVGTESQIISPELYGKGAQDKYAALITDEDENGEAHIPVFYKGRIYFDFRSADRFEESYEQLLRWAVDRPQHVKPKLGAVPETILAAAPVASGTSSRARRAEDALRQGSAAAAGLIREYGDALVAELRLLAPIETDGEAYDDTILKALEAIRPYLRQFAELVLTAVRFVREPRDWDRILAIHEQLGTLMFRDADVDRWNTHQFDAYKFAAHDAFLGSIALALDEERFDLVAAALDRPYLVEARNAGHGRATESFTVFSQYAESMEARKRRLQLNRISLEADILHAATPRGSVPSYDALMQADFLLFLRSTSTSVGQWFPYSLVYASTRFAPFTLFARAESQAYFARIAPLLGTSSIAAFKAHIAALQESERNHRMFGYQGLPIAHLANAENIGVLP
jgi:hypothetical protein